MKKQSLFTFMAFMLFLSVKAFGVTTPDPGKSYYIVHSSGNFISEASGALTIATPSAASNQFFKFIPVAGSTTGAYNIQVGSTSGYILKTGSWDVTLGTDPAAALAQFTVETVGDSIKLKCSDGGYLGTDAVTAGSLIYSNKNGLLPIHHWILMEAVDGQFVLFSLNNAIASAQSFKTAAVIGGDAGQYNQSDYNAFASAIATAIDVAGNPASQIAINDATTSLNAATATFLATKHGVLPQPGKTYFIKHSGGMYITETSGAVKTNILSGNNNQYFKFIPIAGSTGVYNIKVSSTGGYITKSGGYNVVFGTDSTTNLAKFNIEVVAGTIPMLKFKCLDNSKYLGVDNTTANQSIYSDKPGTSTLQYWTVSELKTDVIILDGLNAAITSAQTLKTASVAGTEVGQYPQSAYDTFVATIASATAVVNNPVSQTAVNDATNALIAATTVFAVSPINPVFTADKTYYIVHSSGLYITDANGTVSINTPAGTDGQHYKLIPVQGRVNQYYIQEAVAGSYIAKTNNYNVGIVNDSTANVAKFTVEVVPGTKTFKLKCLDNTRYLGTDAVAAGSLLFSDKDGTSVNHYWSTKEYIAGELITDALTTGIAAATTFKNAAVVGTLKYQYLQADYDIFAAAITTASTVLSSATTQTAINDAATVLKAAQATFAAAKIKPKFIPETGALYRISSNKYPKYFLNGKGGIVSGKEVRIAGATEQLWEFTSINDTTYVIKNAGSALTHTATLDQVSTDQWTIRYNSTDSNIEYYGILFNGTTCLSLASDSTAALQTYSATNTAHMMYFTKADMPNDPDKAALAAYIPTAKATLASKTIGTVTGTWPQSAYDTFNAVILSASAIVDGSGNTQATVDAKLTELKAAETTFINAKIIVVLDRTVITPKLADANAKLAAAVIGEQVGQYLMSTIENFRTAVAASTMINANAGTQAVIDNEVTVLQGKIDAFVAATNQSVINVSVVLTDVIPFAQALYNGGQSGMDKGQYPASVKAALQTAITTATGIQNPVRADLDALLQAMTTFKAGIMTADRSALKTTLASAQTLLGSAVAGSFNGQYPQVKIDGLTTAVASANLLYNNILATQTKIDSTKTSVASFITTLNASKVVIQFATLTTSLSSASTLISAAVVGTLPGQYPQVAIDAFNVQITHATSIKTSTQVNQITVDSMVVVLNTAITTFKSSAVPTVTTALKAIIDQAQTAYDNAVVGVVKGTYPASAKQSFANKITYAKGVYDNSSSTQSSIDLATSILTSALATFSSSIIQVEKAALLDGISAANAFNVSIVAGTYTQASLDSFIAAIAAAQAVYDNALSSQADVDSAISVLTSSKDRLVIAGLASNIDNSIFVCSANSAIYLKGLVESSKISIWNMVGQIISSTTYNGNVYKCEIASGSYIVSVVSQNHRKSMVVIVK